MRILNTITTMDPKSGGPAEWVKHFGSCAEAMGHTVHTVSMDPPGAEFLSELPVQTTAVGATWKGQPTKGFYSDILVEYVQRHAKEYDCVLIHGLWRFTGPGTRRALQGTGVPYFVYTHGMLDPWFKREYPVKHFFKSLYWHLNEYPVLRDARGVIFTSEQERISSRESFQRYKAEEQALTPGISEPPAEADIDMDAFAHAFPQIEGRPYFLFLGRIHEIKGCDLLIRGFAEVAEDCDHLLVIAGPDQKGLVAEYKQSAVDLGVAERIVWTGMVGCDVKWSAIRNAEAFTILSHHENFGMAVAEALACGVPVLISDKIEIYREILADGAGMAAVDSAEGAGEVLQKYLDLPEAERREMRRKARECYLSRFEIRTATEKLLRYLQEKMDGRS